MVTVFQIDPQPAEADSASGGNAQRKAARSGSHCVAALHQPYLRCGAGSGKSYTVSGINAVCEECDLEVVLSAPTGKAAKRLEEVSGRTGTAIHRLLGYDASPFPRTATIRSTQTS